MIAPMYSRVFHLCVMIVSVVHAGAVTSTAMISCR